MNQQLSQERGRNMSHLSEEKFDELVAAERARELEPLNDWRTIAARAKEEGLIRDSFSRGWSGQLWMQAAAAVLLLIGGIAIGRTTIGLPSAIEGTAGNTAAIESTASTTVPTSTADDVRFASVDEASAALKRAVSEYQLASEY